MCPTLILLHCSIIYFFFPTAAHVPIYTQDFSAHVEKLFANDKYGFSEEYKVIANNIFNTYATFYPYLKCTGFNAKFKTDDIPVYRKYKKHHPNMKVNFSVCQ